MTSYGTRSNACQTATSRLSCRKPLCCQSGACSCCTCTVVRSKGMGLGYQFHSVVPSLHPVPARASASRCTRRVVVHGFGFGGGKGHGDAVSVVFKRARVNARLVIPAPVVATKKARRAFKPRCIFANPFPAHGFTALCQRSSDASMRRMVVIASSICCGRSGRMYEIRHAALAIFGFLRCRVMGWPRVRRASRRLVHRRQQQCCLAMPRDWLR